MSVVTRGAFRSATTSAASATAQLDHSMRYPAGRASSVRYHGPAQAPAKTNVPSSAQKPGDVK